MPPILFFLLSFLFFAMPLYATEFQGSVERINPVNSAEAIQNEKIEQEIIPTPIFKIINNKKEPTLKQTPGAKPIMFTFGGIELSGNTVISNNQLKKTYQDKIGKPISLEEVEVIKNSITEYYRNAGYLLSQAVIPEQEVTSNGVIKILIVEGYIDKITVKGCTKTNVCNLLKKYGAQIKKNKPLTLKTLERYAFLASDIPGIEIRTVLSKADQNVGATDLTFIVKEKNYDASIGYNDYNSVALGRQQYYATASTYNILTASTTSIDINVGRFTDRLKYIALTNRQQLNGNGLGGNFSVSYIKTKPNLSSINVTELLSTPGKALMASVGMEYAWIRSHSKNMYIGGSFNFINSKTTFGNFTLFEDNLRYINIYGSYAFLSSSKTYNRLTINYTQGLPIFGANDNPPSRVGEKLNFLIIGLNASQAHRFSYEKLSSYISVAAQYAFNIVPSAETINYGGILYGLGYDPASISGDRGFEAKAELQHTAIKSDRFKMNSQIFIFVDTGFVWDISSNSEPGVPAHQYGYSAGGGFRANALKHVLFDFILAQPLNPAIAIQDKGYLRILFNIKFYV